MSHGLDLLRTMWVDSGDRLLRRLDGLTDTEFFWEPGPGSWSLRRDPAAPNGWQIDYVFPPPTPAPLTTIAWRLIHLANGNWIRWEHVLGTGTRTFLDLPVPGTADESVRYWQDSRSPVTQWLSTADDAELRTAGTTLYGEAVTTGDTVRILLDEQTHHGAEIGLLRDLYLRIEPTGVAVG